MSTPPVPPADDGAPSSGVPSSGGGRPADSNDLEHDPTGIRALLSALPDPGPMPDDLVARITASIAHEQSAREGGAVVPLRRRRSWGWQHLGAAAAAAVVLAVGVPALLTGTSPGAMLASLGGGSSADSASGSAAGPEQAQSQADAGKAPGSTPGTLTVAPRSQPSPTGDQRVRGAVGQVTMMTTGTAYTTAGLTTQAARLSALGQSSLAAKDANGVSGEAGLRSCLTALGVESWLPLDGDVATLDGAPAVIALVDRGSTQTVYAVAPDCDAQHPRLLAGPLTVP